MRLLLILVILLSTLASAGDTEKNIKEGRDSFFPMYRNELGLTSEDLPKPYGLSIVYFGLDQDVDVKSVDLMFASDRLNKIMEENVDLIPDGAEVEVRNITLKADLWVLPFLNIYGLIGRTEGTTRTTVDAVIDKPGPGAIEIDGIKLEMDYEGVTYGGGTTLVGAYRDIFLMLDANYTYTDLDITQGHMKVLIIDPRIGYRTSVLERELRLWVGAMYLKIDQKLKGNLKDAIGVDLPVTYNVNQKPADDWHYLAGASIEIIEAVEVFTELGFGNKDSIGFGMSYRM